ncbi:hypothetical protein PybrP1_001865 [[Pythium] brassicae (nom. inval.)]|nr:hypothetical protein PybrP1_001865 [[Pythium] brassicae (nom. inval.)]
MQQPAVQAQGERADGEGATRTLCPVACAPMSSRPNANADAVRTGSRSDRRGGGADEGGGRRAERDDEEDPAVSAERAATAPSFRIHTTPLSTPAH